MSEDPRPFVSTVSSDMRAAGVAEITYYYNGKAFRAWLGPSDIVTRAKKIEGKARYMVAAYLCWLSGNRCAIGSAFCSMGDSPFAEPASADFDHINGNNRDHSLKNLRLACHSCNSHAQQEQTLQWKRNAVASTVATTKIEKPAAVVLPTGYAPIDLNVDLYPAYSKMVDEGLKIANGIPLEDAIYRFARELHKAYGHGAWQTTRGYLKVLTTGDDAPYYVEEGTKLVKRRTSISR